MLIKCLECGLQVSDKALSCPHCGYPMVSGDKQKRHPRQNRRKRLPNGFGQITEIKGKSLRKPFRAMVTVGKTAEGKPICRLLKPESYFETYNDAYTALLEYNRNPYDFDSNLTMKQLYDQWSVQHFKKMKSDTGHNYIVGAWRQCKPIYDMKVRDVRPRHMKPMIEDADTTRGIKARMKMVLNMMLDYAVEYEIVDHNYARDFKVENYMKNPDAHHTFSDEELKTLWANVGDRWVDMILVQCYSGWRPTELCSLKKLDIDLDIGCMIGGSKTEAGRNRKVPIHDKIFEIVKRYIDSTDSEFLFGGIHYERYRQGFVQTMVSLELRNHTPHDCRVCFITSAKKCGMDEYAIKLIVGHAIEDVTERVYTKRDFDWLKEEMQKIK